MIHLISWENFIAVCKVLFHSWPPETSISLGFSPTYCLHFQAEILITTVFYGEVRFLSTYHSTKPIFLHVKVHFYLVIIYINSQILHSLYTGCTFFHIFYFFFLLYFNYLAHQNSSYPCPNSNQESLTEQNHSEI